MFLATKTLIGNRARHTSATDLLRIGEFVNDVMFAMYAEIGYVDDVRETITTTSGLSAYALASHLFPVKSPLLIPSEEREVTFIPRAEYDRRFLGRESSGTPEIYTIEKNVGVHRQPAGKISVKSTSASDGSTKTITFYGIVNEVYTEETVTMNGTTFADTTKEFTRLTRPPLLSAAAVGTISYVTKVTQTIRLGTIAAAATTGTFSSPHQLLSVLSSSTDTRTVAISGTIILVGAADGDGYINPVSFAEVQHTEIITLNGTTAVPTTKYFVTVDNVSVSSVGVTGTLLTTTVMISSPARATTEIGSIAPGYFSAEHQIIKLEPIPDSALEILYHGERQPPPLVNSADRPSIDSRVWIYIQRWAEVAFMDFIGDRRGITIMTASGPWKDDISHIRRLLADGGPSRTIKRGSASAPIQFDSVARHWNNTITVSE